MAVAYDTASATQAFSNVSSVTTWTHTASGSDRYVRLSITWAKLGTTTCSATYGGNAMTSVGLATASANWISSVTGKAQIFEYVAPATSAETVAPTFSASGNYGAAGTVSYTGVDQTTPSGAAFTGSAGSAGGVITSTRTVTDAVTGDMVSDCIAVDTSSSSLTAGSTQRFNGVGSGYNGAGQDAAGSASVAMTWTWTSNNGYAHVAAAIKQASGGGTTVDGNLGTAAASGFTGNVNANRTIAGALGTATASGFQGTVSNSTDTTIAGNLGTATASGFTGGVNANRTIAGALGTAVASGFQGTVSNTSDTVVTGSVGTATASGIAGTVAWNRTVAGSVGEAIASGLAGTVQSGDAPEVAQPIGGGGYLPSFRRKTRKEIHAERVRLGILPEEIRKAAQKVVEKAAEQGDPQEVYEDNTERYRAMFLREVGATKWAPDYARAIRIQLELMERDAEDALLLM